MAVRRTCLYIEGAMRSQNKKNVIKNKTNSPLPNHIDQCKCSSLIDVLATKLELLSKALTDANTKNAAIWTKVDKELFSLNEYLALPTPGLLAAKKVIRLSDAAIKTASYYASSRTHVTSQCRLLSAVIDGPQQMWAKWLSIERETGCLYIEGAMRSQNKKNVIKNKTNSPLPNHIDQCKCSSLIDVLATKLELLSKALTDANTKNAAIWTKVDKELFSLNEYLALPTPGLLAAKKVIRLSDAAIKTATPKQTTATPDSSFYSTSSDPSNSKCSGALERASLTWTERPKYVELSALLSVTDVKGAPVNSTPKSQPSWIGSDKRSQVVKPTGQPITCADVDIGECCENRITTEAVKLPSSSSTPSKDHDSQSLKPDHGEPDSPSYTQLAMLVAGTRMFTQARKKGDCGQTNHIQLAKSETCWLASVWSTVAPRVHHSHSSPPEDDHFLIRTLGQLSSSCHFTHLLLLSYQYVVARSFTSLNLQALTHKSSCHGNEYPFSDCGNPDDRYGAVQKPKYVNAMTAWLHHTQTPPTTIFFRISTATSCPIEPVVETTTANFSPGPNRLLPAAFRLTRPNHASIGMLPTGVTKSTAHCLLLPPFAQSTVPANPVQSCFILTVIVWPCFTVCHPPLRNKYYYYFICHWARNPEPKTWIRNFCRTDFSGVRIFLDQVKLGPASVEDLCRTIIQKVHETDAIFVPKKLARSRVSRKPPKRIRRLLEKKSQLFFKKLTTGDAEDELVFRKMRNRCKSEIRQWNIRKQATILDLARKNRNVLFKYMRHRRRNKPSAFSLRERNGEPTSDPIVVSEFYRDHYAGVLSSPCLLFADDLKSWISNASALRIDVVKAFAVLRMIRRTFSRITRMDFQILYGAYVGPLLEYANPVVYSGHTKDVILIERVQRAATKMVAGLKSMDCETRLVVLDLFPLEHRRLRGDLLLTYALFEQGLARGFSPNPIQNTIGHLSTQVSTLESILPRAGNLKSSATPFFHLCLSGERQLRNDRNKTGPGNLGESLDIAHQSVNPWLTAEHDAYARELAVLYSIDPKLDYGTLLDELKKVLDSKKTRLQKLYKMKAGVHKIEGARVSSQRPVTEYGGASSLGHPRDSAIEKRSSKLATTDVVKSINEEVQDLTQDIGDLETSLLYLKHSSSSTGGVHTSSATSGSERLVRDQVAELQKALDIELQVRSGAQRLVERYKMGPRDVLEEAKRQCENANKKIGFIRNQMVRVKQQNEFNQQFFSRLAERLVLRISYASSSHHRRQRCFLSRTIVGERFVADVMTWRRNEGGYYQTVLWYLRTFLAKAHLFVHRPSPTLPPHPLYEMPRWLKWLRREFSDSLRVPKEGSSVYQLRRASVAGEHRAHLARKLLGTHSHVDDEDCLDDEWRRVKEAMLPAFRT
ncbi:protein kinase N, partial [Clonorchis sinensis]